MQICKFGQILIICYQDSEQTSIKGHNSASVLQKWCILWASRKLKLGEYVDSCVVKGYSLYVLPVINSKYIELIFRLFT